MRIVLTLLLVSLAHSAQAQVSAASAINESRDAALAYIGTANFIVGRVGRDCLSLSGRSETPQEFAARWQQRNGRFIQASSKYLALRLDEAHKQGGASQREAVQAELRRAIQQAANPVLASWFEKGDKTASCKQALALIDEAKYDFGPTSSSYRDLESLVNWAQGQ